jgi:hypothetical protein
VQLNIFRSRERESVAYSRGFIEAHLQFLVKVRVDFGHRVRLVGHPEAVDVFQNSGFHEARPYGNA